MTFTLPLHEMPGYGPSLREHLADVLSPYPAEDGEPFAFSIHKNDAGADGYISVLSGMPWPGRFDSKHVLHSPRALMDRCGGAAFHIEAQMAFHEKVLTMIKERAWLTSFNLICLPQGALLVADSPARALDRMRFHAKSDTPTQGCARAVFTILEGKDTSNHERLALISVAERLVADLLEQDRRACLGEIRTRTDGIRLAVVPPNMAGAVS